MSGSRVQGFYIAIIMYNSIIKNIILIKKLNQTNSGMRIIIIIVALISFLLGTAHPKCIEGDCINGKGVFVSDDGIKYEGSFKDGKPHGSGVLYMKNGGIYRGEFKNGLPDGEGEMIYPDGKTFQGKFKEGNPYGKGVLIYPSGIKLKGYYKDGKFIGLRRR